MNGVHYFYTMAALLAAMSALSLWAARDLQKRQDPNLYKRADGAWVELPRQ